MPILISIRELAAQIYSVLETILAFHPPSAALLNPQDDTHMPDSANFDTVLPNPSTTKVVPQLLVGGTTTPAQDLSKFLTNSPNLLVATPGRLLDLLSSPYVHCPQSSFDILIMDEADRLLDLGFQDTLQKILARLPKQRRTGLFSASMSEALDQLVRVGLRMPVRIAVKVRSASGVQDKKTPASLQMAYVITKPTHRWPAVNHLLTFLDPTPQKTLIYLSTCAAVDYWQYILPAILPSTFITVPLHGKHPSNVRTRNFTKFVNTTTPAILLTTDVAARGLDVPSVDLVVQIDPPSDPKTFIHRCGRAGRAGRKGLAVLFLTPGKEADYIEFLRIRQTPISPLEMQPALSITDASAHECTLTIRETVLRDRAIHDKAQRAFVSWVRSYSKHAASSIFDTKDIDWDEQGHAWGLLRLPKMPELGDREAAIDNEDKKARFKRNTRDRSLGLNIDFDSYAYLDRTREEKRLADLATYRASKEAELIVLKERDLHTRESNLSVMQRLELERRAARNGHLTLDKRKARSWSVQKDKKTMREQKRDKKHTKRELERLGRMDTEQLGEEKELQDMLGVIRSQVQSGQRTDIVPDEEFMGFD